MTLWLPAGHWYRPATVMVWWLIPVGHRITCGMALRAFHLRPPFGFECEEALNAVGHLPGHSVWVVILHKLYLMLDLLSLLLLKVRFWTGPHLRMFSLSTHAQLWWCSGSKWPGTYPACETTFSCRFLLKCQVYVYCVVQKSKMDLRLLVWSGGHCGVCSMALTLAQTWLPSSAHGLIALL